MDEERARRWDGVNVVGWEKTRQRGMVGSANADSVLNQASVRCGSKVGEVFLLLIAELYVLNMCHCGETD